MAQASSSSFDQWIRSLLNDLQNNDDDMSDFVEYLHGIVTSDSETDEEKLVAIGELLSDLDLKHNHPTETLSQQILDRWNSNDEQTTNRSTSSKTSQINDDDAINTALINAMNQIESTARQQKPNKTHDDETLKKHKSQVLAKYSEVSDDEFGYDDELSGTTTQDDGLFQNTNSQDIDDRDKRAREAAHEAHKKQQERNKVDAANQKQKDEERKKKAQQRAQKQERRR